MATGKRPEKKNEAGALKRLWIANAVALLGFVALVVAVLLATGLFESIFAFIF